MLNRIFLNLTIVIVILLFALPIFFKNQDDPVEANKKNATEVNYNLSEVTLVGHKDGEKQWQLIVDNVTDQGKDKAYLEGLQNGQLYQDGAVRYYLAANSGEYNRQLDEFKLKDNVVVNGVQGEIIKANEIEYNNSKKKLITGPVEITDDKVEVQAGKVAIDVDAEIFEFSGGVEVNFTIDDEEEENEEELTTDQIMGGEKDVK